jgi:uncharacterized CHY-type Zn-finger protein
MSIQHPLTFHQHNRKSSSDNILLIQSPDDSPSTSTGTPSPVIPALNRPQSHLIAKSNLKKQVVFQPYNTADVTFKKLSNRSKGKLTGELKSDLIECLKCSRQLGRFYAYGFSGGLRLEGTIICDSCVRGNVTKEYKNIASCGACRTGYGIGSLRLWNVVFQSDGSHSREIIENVSDNVSEFICLHCETKYGMNPLLFFL